jgi:hypothetical protein
MESGRGEISSEAKQDVQVVRGSWWQALHAMIATDIELLYDEPEKIVRMLDNLIKRKPDYLTGEREFDNAFVNIHDALTMHSPDSLLYKLITQREQKDNQQRRKTNTPIIALPSIDEVRGSAMVILREVCAEQKLAITSDKPPAKLLPDFIPGKQYVYEEIFSILNAHFAAFGIIIPDLKRGWVFINLLARFSGARDFSLQSVEVAHQKDSTMMRELPGGVYINVPVMHIPVNAFYVDMKASYENFAKLSGYCNKATLENDAIERLVSEESAYSICMRIKPIIQLLSSKEFRQSLENFFANAAVLANFKLFLADKKVDEQTQHQALVSKINAMGKKHKLNVSSDLFEATLLQAYGIQSEFKVTQFQPAQRYDSFMTFTDFYLNITREQAHQLVAAINQQFPAAAAVIEENTSLEDREAVTLQLITVKREVLVSDVLMQKLTVGLDCIQQANPVLFKKLEFDSAASDFYDLSARCKNYCPIVSQALVQLYLTMANHKSRQEIDDANFEVDKALARTEATCHGAPPLVAFSKSIKLEIKAIQKRIGLRAEKSTVMNNAEKQISVVDDLQQLSQQCKLEYPQLSQALSTYSSLVVSSKPTKEAHFAVKKALAAVEEKCVSRNQHTLFKRGLKQNIKTVLCEQETSVAQELKNSAPSSSR